MSLLDDYKSGTFAATWNSSPIYPGAIWEQRINLGTPSIEGFEFEIYARSSERSTTRLFDIPFTPEDIAGEVVLFTGAPGANTTDAFLNKTMWVTCQFTETATGEVRIAVEGLVQVGVGSIPAAE